MRTEHFLLRKGKLSNQTVARRIEKGTQISLIYKEFPISRESNTMHEETVIWNNTLQN